MGLAKQSLVLYNDGDVRCSNNDDSIRALHVHAGTDYTSVCHAQFGNGTLRLTTRQTYQLHGVLKQDLKSVFSSVIKNMGSTLGACGDVNRNVLAPPVRLLPL